MLEQEGQTDRDVIDGADTRANLSEWYDAIIEQEEQEEPEGYETQRMTFKSVSTKKSGRRGKAISKDRREDEHIACCSKKSCHIF